MKQKYEEKKFKELVLYIAAKCQTNPRFGSTHLNKVLFYSDFLAFRHRGRAITGATYQKLRHGPAPRAMLPAKQELISNGAAAEQLRTHFGYTQKRLVALRDPDLSSFDGEEIALVDGVIEILSDLSAADVSELSHRVSGWQLVDETDDIPYYTALTPTLSQDLPESALKYGETVLQTLSAE